MNEIATNRTTSTHQNNTKYTVIAVSALSAIAAVAGVIVYKTQYSKKDTTANKEPDAKIDASSKMDAGRSDTPSNKIEQLRANIKQLDALKSAKEATYMSGGVLKDAKERYLPTVHPNAQIGDEYMHNFVQHYLQLLYDSGAQWASTNAAQVRESMLALAKRSVDMFATYNTTTKQDDNDNSTVSQANIVRKIICSGIFRFEAMKTHDFNIEQQGIVLNTDTLPQVRQSIQNVLQMHSLSPAIPLAFDLAVLYLVRAAHIDEGVGNGNQEKVAKRAYDYIVSALTQIAYGPRDILLYNLRAAQQKQTCLTKIELNSYAIGMIIQALLDGGEIQDTHRDMLVVIGNIAMLNELSHTNYILDLFVSQILSGNKDAKAYVDSIRQDGAQLEDTKIHETLRAYMAKIGAQNIGLLENIKFAYALKATVIGKALSQSDEDGTNKAIKLFSDVMKLSTSELNTLSTTMNDISVQQNAQISHILQEAWQLEYKLLCDYIQHNHLNPIQMHRVDRLGDSVERLFCTHISDFDPKETKQVEAELSAQKLMLEVNKDEAYSGAGKLFELLDADARKGNIYTTDQAYRYAMSMQISKIILELTTKNIANIANLLNKN